MEGLTHVKVLEGGDERQHQQLHKLRHGLVAEMRGVVSKLDVVHLHDQSPTALWPRRGQAEAGRDKGPTSDPPPVAGGAGHLEQ